MGGRRPTPTALNRTRGNPGKRPINRNEPHPAAVVPWRPDHLSDAAVKEWDRAAEILLPIGLLTEADCAQFAVYCQAWGRWVEAEELLKKHGIIVRAPNTGFPMQSPILAIANRAMEQLQHALIEFGMSPASRAKVSASKRGSGGGWDDI